jgi:serine/threonine protein kinase
MGCCASSASAAYFPTKQPDGQSGTAQPFVRNMQNIREYYTVVKCLGTGNFGSVYLIKDKRSGVERVAKELIKTLINTNVTAKLEAELAVIKNLVKFT